MSARDPDHGITVTEISPMDQPIRWHSTSTAAFIGRALRGPLDTPVLVESVSAFIRRFGGRWRHSCLFDAVEEFFQHGGRRLYIVRVANNATGASLQIPGPQGPLCLRAVEPGSSEVLRAAVDYDGVADSLRFNITLQRLSPETRLVIDQEIFPGVSCDPSDANFIGEALAASALVELRAPLPAARPHATMGPAAASRAPYVLLSSRGSDGTALYDYDLIGSAMRGTGLFSLEAIEELDLIYLPPRTPDCDIGPAALLAAELYCRRRGAMLVMDPASGWQDAKSAIAAVDAAGLAAAHIVSFFPGLASLEGNRPAGAALAGLLCKLDALHGPWGNLEVQGFAFSRALRPLRDLAEADQQLLLRHGLNPLVRDADGRLVFAGGVTLARSVQAELLNTSLAMKRFSLKIARTVERATRWAVFESDRAKAVARVERQVEELLHELGQRGAIHAAFVRCETHHDSPQLDRDRGLAVMLTLQTRVERATLSLTLYQNPSGCRIASTAFAPVDELQRIGTDAA